jgi:hypothetical protein
VWNRIAAVLTGAALLIGVWGVVLWWNRPRVPPLGPLTLEEATPPGATLDLRPQRYCSHATAGFWATGETSMSIAETDAWYVARFGDVLEEATLRLNRGEDGDSGFLVLEDLTIWRRVEQGRARLWVQTYETTSHVCLHDEMDRWDSVTAGVFMDACNEPVLTFWGTDYGAPEPSEPPPTWSVISLSGDRAIAHDIEDPLVVYARAGPDEAWQVFQAGEGCYNG